MQIARIAAVLVALVAIGCGQQPEVEQSGSGTVTPTSLNCQPGEATCGIPSNPQAIFRCVEDSAGNADWRSDLCTYGCVSQTGTDGLSHDYCSQCEIGASYCQGAVRWVCGSDGYYHHGGSCSRCDCGGTYPHCKLCN